MISIIKNIHIGNWKEVHQDSNKQVVEIYYPHIGVTERKNRKMSKNVQ